MRNSLPFVEKNVPLQRIVRHGIQKSGAHAIAMNCKTLLPLVLLLSMLPSSLWAQDSTEGTKRAFRHIGMPFYSDCRTTILPTGEVKFADLFEAIGNARRHIYMDYFKFQQDSICTALLDMLCSKAQQGIDVRILYDSFGNNHSSQPLTKPYLKAIRAAGVRIEAFDPVRFPWINHLLSRDHHKIAVIDGQVVYTGGMNVADYYLHGKPQVGEWRDMHIRMGGPIVAAYTALFCRMWEKTTGEALTPAIASDSTTSPLTWQSTGVEVAFADRWPRNTPKIMHQSYCAAIDNASRLVQIVNPYASLSDPIRAALRRALKRGVRVQFMASAKSDGAVNDLLVGLEMKKLMDRGAEVYYYKGGFHHSKIMMVDSLFCTIGTTNLDARSLRYDYEVNAFIFDPTTTHALQDIFADDVAKHCDLLTPELWETLFPRTRRIRARFFMLAKRLM